MQDSIEQVNQIARQVKLLALDVDGVLTDGRIYMGNTGEEYKAFNILDGMGIKLLQQADVKVALITSRESILVKNRADDLGIKHVFQGRDDKLEALDELLKLLNLDYTQVAYMGDDLPDLPVIRRVALGITVADGHHFVAKHARWITKSKGGEGAVREACELILSTQEKLDEALDAFL